MTRRVQGLIGHASLSRLHQEVVQRLRPRGHQSTSELDLLEHSVDAIDIPGDQVNHAPAVQFHGRSSRLRDGNGRRSDSARNRCPMARGTEPHEDGIAVAEPRSRHSQPRRFQGGAPVPTIAPLRGRRVDAFRKTDQRPTVDESSDCAARMGEVRFQVLRAHRP